MCGIFGYVGEAGGVGEGVLAVAQRELHHRGPDASGAATFAHGERRCGMAHTRLAILDLSPAGQQPMGTRDGRFTLVFNGEIYNHLALRPELEAAGVAFTSTSDTETALHALAAWGEGAVDRFVGMFAFALWDQREGSLLLARDRLGQKPLYWCRAGDGIAFSSEVRALLASGLVRPRVDPEGLARWLCFGAAQDPHALVEGVEALMPGELLRWSGPGRLSRRRYWRIPEPLSPVERPQERLASLLDDAVRLRLLADVPLGVFLSGGVDASAIAAVASRHARGALNTFTLTFDEARYDEGERAAMIARHLGVRHHAAHLGAAAATRDVAEAFAAQDLPSHDGVNMWFISRAARRHGLVVALSGTGGDELFAGYPHFQRFPTWVAVGRAARWLPRRLREHLLDELSPALPTRARKALGILGTRGDATRIAALIREVFSGRQRRALLGRRPRASSGPDAAAAPALDDPGRTLTRLELQGYLANTQLRDIDAMSMAHGFEVRAPLLDHRLVELAMAIPSAAKAPRGGLLKPLLIEAAGLPAALFRVPKRGFVLPWERWLRGPLRPWADDALQPDAIGAGGLLEPHAVARIWRAFLAGSPSVNATRILSLVALTTWARRHGIEVPA